MLKLKDDLGRQRPRQGLKGPKGPGSAINAHIHVHIQKHSHTHMHTLRRQGQRQSQLRAGEARPGQVFEAPTVAAASSSSHTKKRVREEDEERAKKKNSLPLLLFFIYFLFFFKYTSIKKYFYSCARDAVERAALETSFLSVSLSHLLSHSLFVLIHCTNKSQL